MIWIGVEVTVAMVVVHYVCRWWDRRCTGNDEGSE